MTLTGLFTCLFPHHSALCFCNATPSFHISDHSLLSSESSNRCWSRDQEPISVWIICRLQCQLTQHFSLQATFNFNLPLPLLLHLSCFTSLLMPGLGPSCWFSSHPTPLGSLYVLSFSLSLQSTTTKAFAARKISLTSEYITTVFFFLYLPCVSQGGRAGLTVGCEVMQGWTRQCRNSPQC